MSFKKYIEIMDNPLKADKSAVCAKNRTYDYPDLFVKSHNRR